MAFKAVDENIFTKVWGFVSSIFLEKHIHGSFIYDENYKMEIGKYPKITGRAAPMYLAYTLFVSQFMPIVHRLKKSGGLVTEDEQQYSLVYEIMMNEAIVTLESLDIMYGVKPDGYEIAWVSLIATDMYMRDIVKLVRMAEVKADFTDKNINNALTNDVLTIDKHGR